MSGYEIRVGDKIRAARESGGSTTVMTGKVTKVEASAVPGTGRYFAIEGISGIHYLHEWVVTLIEKAELDLPDGLYVADPGDHRPEALKDQVVLRVRGGVWSFAGNHGGGGYGSFLENARTGAIRIVRLVKEGTC